MKNPPPQGGKGFAKRQSKGGKGFEKVVRKGSLRFENRQPALGGADVPFGDVEARNFVTDVRAPCRKVQTSGA